MEGGEKITQISLLTSLGTLAAGPLGGTVPGAKPVFAGKAGSLFGASFGTVLSSKISKNSAPVSNDPLGVLQALLAQGVAPSAIIDQAAEILGIKPPPQSAGPPDTGPPGTRAQRLLATLQAMLAQEQGASGNVEQTNELSGTNLDTGTPVKVSPARSEQTVATQVVTDSLRSLLASVVLGLSSSGSLSTAESKSTAKIVPQSPSQISTESATSSATQSTLQPVNVPVGNSSMTAALAQAVPGAPGSVPNDLLARMVGRAVVAAIPQFAATNTPIANPAVTASLAQSTPQAQSGTDTTASSTSVGAGLDHLVLLATARAMQGDTSSSSQSFEHQTLADPTLSAGPQRASSAPTPVSFASLMASTTPIIPTSATLAQASAPPVDSQAIIEQVVHALSIRQVTDGSEVRMRLVPEHLGELVIRLTVTGSTVSASVVAQNADVRQTLLSNQHHLANALEESGLKLSGFSVDVFGGNAGNPKNEHDGTSGFGRHYVVHELASNSEDTTLVAEPSFGPPQLLASSAGLLNHLV